MERAEFEEERGVLLKRDSAESRLVGTVCGEMERGEEEAGREGS
jgi:hypothetical protein